MTKDPNFVSVRLPDDVAIWLREYATANKLVRADKPNMGGSIISIVRTAMSGQTISNNVGQSSAAPDVDIDSKINEAIAAKLSEIKDEIKEEYGAGFRGISANITDLLQQRDREIDELKTAIAPLLDRLEALENTCSEVTTPRKFYSSAIAESESNSAPNVAESSVEPESLPSIEAIATIAAPSIEKSLDNKALSDEIAATDKPKILTRPEALAIAQNFGFNGTGQNLYDWSKAALTAKSDESRLANSQKLASVGLVAVLSLENKPAWQAKNQS